MPMSWRWVVGLILGAVAIVGTPADAADARTRTVVIGPQYKAGAFHRWLWGTDYRPLWTTPVEVKVLDLDGFAGGLTPLARVGGQQTHGLALRGADGRDYTFRIIDKDPSSILPEELLDTWARGLVQDQIAASQPTAFLVVDELMDAAGIFHTQPYLVVMPDDVRLGAFREDFAGVVGQLSEYPRARSESNPGFQGAVEIVKHDEFYRRIAADSQGRPDARAFLKARLFDVMIGDWDRHRDQWRWARFEGRSAWQPIPDDRDQAFSRYEGMVLGFSRPRVPFLQSYDHNYANMKGLAWNGREQDRQLLGGLERSDFHEIATALQARITDEVIEKAVRRMPPEYAAIDGARLTRDLKGRRDRLPKAADAFYTHIADKVKVYLTDASDVVEVERLNGGDTVVRVWARGSAGDPVGQPVYHRTLHPRETSEVQIYLGGGNDHMTVVGKPNRITVRAIGGRGKAVVDDTKGGGTRLSDSGSGGEFLEGPGSRLDDEKYTPPPPPPKAPWIPPRDWGRDTFLMPWLSFGSDVGPLVGIAGDTQAFGFRKHPYSSRHAFRAGWAFGESTFRADYRAEFRVENRGWYWGWYASASGTEASQYFGLGNATSDRGRPNDSFFKAKQHQLTFTPALAFPLVRNVTLLVGPTVKYASNKDKEGATLVNEEQPYGYGDFGEIGATALLELDTRDGEKAPGGVALRSFGYPRGGALVQVRGQVFPKRWDVQETFGSVKGSAALYLSPESDRAPTLALRAGGQKVFGRYPYFEAVYLGGGLGGFGGSIADEPVRGLPAHRYAGDSSLYGSADLRVYVSRFRIFLPGSWGVLGFGDAGRVFLAGEHSKRWHKGYGGGLWFAWLDRGNVMSASFARSEGRNAVYIHAGFAF